MIIFFLQIENYTGAARVVVSLVTDEKVPRAHAHKLVGSNCKNGLCTVEIKDNLAAVTYVLILPFYLVTSCCNFDLLFMSLRYS